MDECYASDPGPDDDKWDPVMDVFRGMNISYGTYQTMNGLNDAQIFYGCSPPGVKYFGYDTIIASRAYDHTSPPRNEDGTFKLWHPSINFADPTLSPLRFSLL